jgi:hydrogenase-4 component F
VNPGPAWLPITLLAVPLAAALPALLARGRLRSGLWVAGSAAALALAALQARAVVAGGPIAALGGELLVDGLAAVMALLIAFLAFACSVYAIGYLGGSPAHGRGEGERPEWPERLARLERRLPLFTALFLVLESTLLWVVMTNNIVLLWVALEATTLASALLVSFYWDPRALEAGYKYLLLLTVGITSAFFGCVLLYAAAAPLTGHESALLISHLRGVATQVPPHLALTAALLLLIGFGTKAGLAPFHPWVADAHAEAPAVMSAFLSSIIIKVPFVGLLRVWSIFGPLYPALNEVLLWLGVFTMVTGAALAVAQDDLKRLHAYSSVSQVGFIAAAMGLGTPLGYYAAVFFLLSHALAKGLLFLSTGAVVFAAHEIRSITALGGLRRVLPLTAGCTLVGALSLAGMPPFVGFVAKAQVLLAAADARHWVVLGVGLVTSLITMGYMTGMWQRVFLGRPGSPEVVEEEIHEVPASMRLAMVLLVAAILLLGLRPQWLDPLLNLVAGI